MGGGLASGVGILICKCLKHAFLLSTHPHIPCEHAYSINIALWLLMKQELIQNADDAGATQVQFFVDHRQHGCSNLVKPSLASFQGPSLISANNVMFSEQDWEGIQNLQQSIKAEDPFKVGRFGIGFNSVYHLTGMCICVIILCNKQLPTDV